MDSTVERNSSLHCGIHQERRKNNRCDIQVATCNFIKPVIGKVRRLRLILPARENSKILTDQGEKPNPFHNRFFLKGESTMLLTISPAVAAFLVILTVAVIGALVGYIVSKVAPIIGKFAAAMIGLAVALVLGILIWMLVVSSVTFAAQPAVPVQQYHVAPPQQQFQPAPTATPANSVQPTEAFCQLGVTQMTPGQPTESLSWDAIQLRGYMNDSLAVAIQDGSAYCRTTFPTEVTLLFDSIAADPVMVDGSVVPAGNGRIETGTTFEWIYTGGAVSNGHAYIVQK